MSTLLLAVSMFIPTLLGIEDEKEDVPDLCIDLVDEDSEYVELNIDRIEFMPARTVNNCETLLIKDEFKSLNKVIETTSKDKEDLKDKLAKEKEEKEELDAIIKAQEAQIKESQDNLKRIQEEHQIKLDEERKAKEKAQAKKEEDTQIATQEKEESKVEDKQVATKETSKDTQSKEASKPKEVIKPKEEEPTPDKTSNKASSGGQSYQVTYYTAFCNTGCTGKTATGLDVSNSTTHNGHGVVAVDPSVIPLGSIVEINGQTYSAQDTGGDIKGNRLDILVSSKSEAQSKGRHSADVKIISQG